ncbi:thyrotropin-releasing hormone receptor-like isoform X1 [Nilaparvata lugens]|uniref:Neuropeptide GPCR A6a n=1 Tax=Nilaparvata lugens TaxID=108931 RepID=U3U7L7_NILLU|nr:thyrotropin-releasing hormone receptor-like isoform X1 [Nilaparvata lugens]XP_039284954.1 thyrotropin-releasing hormone receptor-like isoform X1 [Nilaparvata lugens]BAO01055.1 neuropeptide GPCR A6a [Nilaparvata lugens]
MISALASELNSSSVSLFSLNQTPSANQSLLDYNGNYTEIPVFPSYIRTTSMVFCIVILGIGVVGNVMVPIVILKTKDMRNSTNIFLMNLSIADLMVLLVCTPTVLVEVNSKPETWVLGEEMCKAVPFVELTVAHASVLTILAISFERYYAICEPLRAGYVCTKARALLICVLAWAFAAICTSPMMMISKYRSRVRYYDGSLVDVCLTQADTSWSAIFFLATISLFFVLPLGVLVALYSTIARHLTKEPGPASSSDACNQRARRQVVMMLGTVVMFFFLCLLPFRILILWIIVSPPEADLKQEFETYYVVLHFCRSMLYLNSAINPILYNLMSSKFRQGFKSLCGLGRRTRSTLLLRHTGTLTTTLSQSSARTHPHRASFDLSWRSSSIDSRTPFCASRNGSIRRHVVIASSLLRKQMTCPELTDQSESYV